MNKVAKVISIVNQKGGVGKTTTSINLSALFAIQGKKTLLIDIDSQGNSSTGLGINQSKRVVTVYDVMRGDATLKEAIIPTDVENLFIVTANSDLVGIEIEISSIKNNQKILRNKIDQEKYNFDYIIIDCPPALNLLTVNALVASSNAIIPMLCDFYSMEGLSHVIKTIDVIKMELNPCIVISGIVLTMYDKRNLLTTQVEQDVRGCLGNLVYETKIPRNVRLSEAPSHGKAGVIYDHNASGSEAYIRLFKEIMGKMNDQ